MKKIKLATLAVVAVMSTVMLCSCGGETVKKVAYELPYYDGTTRRISPILTPSFGVEIRV